MGSGVVEYLISVRLFQVVQINDCIETDAKVKVYDALATLLSCNVELRELSLDMNDACCAALEHLTALTKVSLAVVADISDEVHAGQENAPQVPPQRLKRA